MEPEKIEHLKEKLALINELIEDFEEKSREAVGIPRFHAFAGLMRSYVRSSEALMGLGVDFSELPAHCALHFANSEASRINADLEKIFPGHGLMIAVPPKDLAESKCPKCKMSMRTEIMHPAYLIRCMTVTCPQRPSMLVVPLLGVTIPITIKDRKVK